MMARTESDTASEKLRSDKISPPVRIALTGNPNSGKTSLFNRITGAAQKVGNWGGVTVEIVSGSIRAEGQLLTFVDLPGTYSLATMSMEEQVAREYLISQKPDVVINVIDATNIERNLYLTVQLLELGIRPILALNMWDEVKSKGISIDVERLSVLLGLPIVKTNARSGDGVQELIEAARKRHHSTPALSARVGVKFPLEIESAIGELEFALQNTSSSLPSARWLAIQLLEHDANAESLLKAFENTEALLQTRDKLEQQLTSTLGDSPDTLIAEARYGFIAGAVRETVTQSKQNRIEHSSMIDAVLTHRVWAFPVFFLFMWLLFQATFKLGEYPMGWIESLFGWLGERATATLPEGVLRDLLVEGVIAGVGGVIVFLPNILILFLGISIMEDTGYMARAAFIMDKLMHRIGLHGKSFIPMLMGLGCTVPAIMAARTLESPKDRIKTILLTPLISCSARLPVFVLFAGALFPRHAGNMVFLFQVVFGFLAFILMGFLFKHTLFRNVEDHPFVMELPPYRLPTIRSLLIHMWHKTEHYLKKMGGVVLAFSVILWWAGAFPKSAETESKFDNKIEKVKADLSLDSENSAAAVELLETEKHAALMEHTYIGRIGKLVEPVVRPFGTDWRGAVSLVTGFVAKEVVVSSMGVLYAVGKEVAEDSEGLQERIRLNFSPLAGFAFMLFVLLYTPCLVALVTVFRELKNWKWSLFSVVYQLTFAWCAATAVFQAGKLLGF